jgi:nucleotide-binding universal stress UspA family protein
MYDHILLPTDGSAEMAPVIDHAVELAAHHGADIHALYVLDTASFGTLPMETSADAITSMLEDEGRTAMESIEEKAEDVTVERTLLDGSPSPNIVDYAEKNDIDVIVMGTHGRGGIDRLLLGSVAERVVRTSDVPVLTVRVGETD